MLCQCRNEVLGWLASIGAERQITDKAAKVPQLTENDWLDLQPKSRKAAVKQVASKPKHPPGKPTHPSSTPQAQQKQHQQQLQHSQRSSQHAKSNAMRATPSNTNPMSKDPAPLDSSKKAAGRPKKRARTREACEYCDKSTHDSEDCPVKLAAEEGSEAEISEDDQSCDQLNEPAHGHTHGGAHGGPHDHMGTDAAEPAPDSAQEESDSEDEEADQEPSVAPEPLRHETVVRREPGREVSFSPEVQDAYKHDPELLVSMCQPVSQFWCDRLVEYWCFMSFLTPPQQ